MLKRLDNKNIQGIHSVSQPENKRIESMANIMNTECPECQNVSANPVIQTDPSSYIFSDEANDMYSSRFGKEIFYRTHLRKCVRCGSEYRTDEISHEILSNLLGLIQEGSDEIDMLRRGVSESKRRLKNVYDYLESCSSPSNGFNITSLEDSLSVQLTFLGSSVVEKLSDSGVVTFADLLFFPFEGLCSISGPLTVSEAKALGSILESSGYPVAAVYTEDFPEFSISEHAKDADQKWNTLKEGLVEGPTRLKPSEKRTKAKAIHQTFKNIRNEITEFQAEIIANQILGLSLSVEIRNSKTDQVLIPIGRKVTKTLIRKLAFSLGHIELANSTLKDFLTYVCNTTQPLWDECESRYDEMMDYMESGTQSDFEHEIKI